MDTYADIARIAATDAFQERVRACAAQQGAADPVHWAYTNRYALASSPGWAAELAVWDEAHPGAEDREAWAADGSVITDQMILAAVQPLIAHGAGT